jgi:hypothetical protein
MALFLLFAYVLGWPPDVNSCTLTGECYCERFDLAALQLAESRGTPWKDVQQPVNTYSNLYAIVSAAFVAWRVSGDRRAGSPRNVISSNWWMADVWVFCVLFLGLGSMWFHGSMSETVSWIDPLSMYVFAGFLGFYTLDRVFVRFEVNGRTRTGVFWTGYLIAVALCMGLDFAGISSEWLIFGLVALYAIGEAVLLIHWLTDRDGPGFDAIALLLWLAGAALFGLAALFRALSTSEGDPMCWPDSWFQPHGLLWHTLSGAMALCIYFYWRRDNYGVGSLPPGYQ